MTTLNKTLCLAAASAALAASPALALDAACERVAAATEKKLAAPAFHDRKQLTGLVHELLLADGKLYQRNSTPGQAPAAWAPAPITLADIRAGAGAHRKALQACRSLGRDSVDGVATEVLGFSIRMGDTVAEGKVWIGSSDGLPYREESAGMKGSTVYRQVKAPL